MRSSVSPMPRPVLSLPHEMCLYPRKKVQKELTRMESLGYISRVEEPTPRCAGMVVVPKKPGSVRISVDFRLLRLSKAKKVFFPTWTMYSSLDRTSKSTTPDSTQPFNASRQLD